MVNKLELLRNRKREVVPWGRSLVAKTESTNGLRERGVCVYTPVKDHPFQTHGGKTLHRRKECGKALGSFLQRQVPPLPTPRGLTRETVTLNHSERLSVHTLTVSPRQPSTCHLLTLSSLPNMRANTVLVSSGSNKSLSACWL